MKFEKYMIPQMPQNVVNGQQLSQILWLSRKCGGEVNRQHVMRYTNKESNYSQSGAMCSNFATQTNEQSLLSLYSMDVQLICDNHWSNS